MAGKKYKDGDVKIDGKKQIYEVFDEWEHLDVDRDEQERGLKRRKRRVQELELAEKQKRKHLEKVLKKANKMNPNPRKDLTLNEMIWLKCDYVLAHIMEEKAHIFFDNVRKSGDMKTYSKLLRIFFFQDMRDHLDAWVQYFAQGGITTEPITLAIVVKEYRKIKGTRTKIKVIHKGEEEREM